MGKNTFYNAKSGDPNSYNYNKPGMNTNWNNAGVNSRQPYPPPNQPMGGPGGGGQNQPMGGRNDDWLRTNQGGPGQGVGGLGGMGPGGGGRGRNTDFGQQPKPGVHPDDWGRVNTNQGDGDDDGWAK